MINLIINAEKEKTSFFIYFSDIGKGSIKKQQKENSRKPKKIR